MKHHALHPEALQPNKTKPRNPNSYKACLYQQLSEPFWDLYRALLWHHPRSLPRPPYRTLKSILGAECPSPIKVKLLNYNGFIYPKGYKLPTQPPRILRGSWDLAIRVLSKVTTAILKYNSN